MPIAPNTPDTPYTRASFLVSHNAHCSLADNWTVYNQTRDLKGQLKQGIRAFMLDLWYETINGQTDIYLLHDYWSYNPGVTYVTLRQSLTILTDFLDANPDEVITVFFEVTPSVTDNDKILEARRAIMPVLHDFSDHIFDPQTGDGLKTKLKDFDKRLVIFSDFRNGDTYSTGKTDGLGLPLTWHYVRESEYGDLGAMPTGWGTLRAESRDSRSDAQHLTLLNHFPTATVRLPGSASLAMFLNVTSIYAHIKTFVLTHGHIANFVALDRYDLLHDGDDNRVPVDAIPNYLKQYHDDGFFKIGWLANDTWLTAPDGLENDAQVHFSKDTPPLLFRRIGPVDNAAFEVYGTSGRKLYLNYVNLSHKVKLYKDPVNFRTKTWTANGETGQDIICRANNRILQLDDDSNQLYLEHQGPTGGPLWDVVPL